MDLNQILTPEGWLEHLRDTGESLHVFLDGVDVTKNSFLAQQGPDGFVDRFKINDLGRKYVDKMGEIAQEHLHGLVVFIPGDPF